MRQRRGGGGGETGWWQTQRKTLGQEVNALPKKAGTRASEGRSEKRTRCQPIHGHNAS